MARITILFAICAIVVASGCAENSLAEETSPAPMAEQRFDRLVAKNPNLTYQQLADQTPERQYVEELSFDPAAAKFYDETVTRLQLTDVEQQMLRKHGLVSVDHNQRYSFGSLYFAVYTNDLPVLITTDSILHAMHRSYDDLLIELEEKLFAPVLDEVLSKCHEQLARDVPSWGAARNTYEDVDLYLTVARNLLHGAGAPEGGETRPRLDAWNGNLLVRSKLNQDEAAQRILYSIHLLKLQTPTPDNMTNIYGGARAIDYSQFQPRGHYTKSVPLKRYFRAMMWLGRADTGWNVLPPDRQSGIISDSPREARNAVLLTTLLQSTGAIDQLKQISGILDFMVGESDNLTVFQLADLLRQQGVDGVGGLASARRIDAFQDGLRKSNLGSQQIRSQVVLSDPNDLYQVPPPGIFQMFGQRFTIDSFVLSKVVFDSIVFDGQKVKRYSPTAVDAMFALGNDSALPLLKEEMVELPYASNLKAARDFVDQYEPQYWQANLYNVWLDALRALDNDLSTEKRLPEVMRSEAWQRKQLQAQLASWAELRHNTVLYAKQSYSAGEKCEYPTGYVEPYPEVYARIKFFAYEAARRIEATDYRFNGGDIQDLKTKQVTFFTRMADTLGKLEELARKELAAEPFTSEDEQWLKKTIDIRGGGSGRPQYSGWYCQLFYGGNWRSADWEPTVVDVHTDPNWKTVLEEGVGNCSFLVVAVDNEQDRMIYVGPAYSYYEFHHPVEERLTDGTWQAMLQAGNEPPRPSWTRDFVAPKTTRHLGR